MLRKGHGVGTTCCVEKLEVSVVCDASNSRFLGLERFPSSRGV